MFTKKLIFLDVDLPNAQAVLEYSFWNLREQSYVKEEYLASILKREGEFPTGLITKSGINVAIPHTEANFAEKEGIVFMRLSSPVTFNHMVDPDEEVETSLVFNIVVKDPKNQVVFLTKLMKMFQDEDLLTYLKTEQDKDNIVKILDQYINKQ